MHRHPAGAEPENRATIGELVQGSCCIGGYRWVTRLQLRYRRADLYALRVERGDIHGRVNVFHAELVVNEPEHIEPQRFDFSGDFTDLSERFPRANPARNTIPIHA